MSPPSGVLAADPRRRTRGLHDVLLLGLTSPVVHPQHPESGRCDWLQSRIFRPDSAEDNAWLLHTAG